MLLLLLLMLMSSDDVVLGDCLSQWDNNKHPCLSQTLSDRCVLIKVLNKHPTTMGNKK